jgi:hypothetical protein
VGMVVSSVPAITAIRHFRGPSGQTYGASSHSHSLKSRTHGHVQLKEYGNTTGNRATVNYGGEDSDASLKRDNDSEEHLVRDKRGAISRTTEVHVSYD